MHMIVDNKNLSKNSTKKSVCIKISFLKYPTVIAIAGVVLTIIAMVCYGYKFSVTYLLR